jgi:hypothetical protein
MLKKIWRKFLNDNSGKIIRQTEKLDFITRDYNVLPLPVNYWTKHAGNYLFKVGDCIEYVSSFAPWDPARSDGVKSKYGVIVQIHDEVVWDGYVKSYPVEALFGEVTVMLGYHEIKKL